MDGASFTMNRPEIFLDDLCRPPIHVLLRSASSERSEEATSSFDSTKTAACEYDTLYYIRGTNYFRYRQNFRSSWLFGVSYRMVGSSPTDFAAD